MSSHVIDVLKGVKEKLPDNYSTEQLLDTLDELILRAVNSIIECSNFLDSRLVTIATWYSTNQRRKISPIDKGQFIASTVAYQLSDTRTKARIYRKLGLERNLSIALIHLWLTTAKEIVDLELDCLCDQDKDGESRLSFLRLQLGVTQPHLIFSSFHTVNYYVKQALMFREQMAEKYMRKVVNEAVAYHKDQTKRNGPRMNLNDIAQNFMVAVLKAIDKCDSKKGTLTTYVDHWLTNAKTTNVFRHETGVAYSLPSGQRKNLATGLSVISNFAVSIDDSEIINMEAEQNQEEELIRQDIINHVRQLSKAVDPVGLGRIYLGITEVLSAEEVSQLRLASQQQLGTQPRQ